MTRAGRAFRLALRAFPRRVRERLETDAGAAFDEAYARRRRQGAWPGLRYLLAALADAVAAGVRERRTLRSAGVVAAPTSREGGGVSVRADVRHALRLYARRPLVAMCVTAVVAGGVASTTAVFGVVEGVLLRSPPWEEPERVVWLQVTRGAETPGLANPLDVADWKDQAQTLSDVAAFGTYEATLQADEAARIGVAEVSEGFDRVLGVGALHGRLLAAEDYAPGVRSVVVSYELWRDRLGADPGVVGRTILVDQQPSTVVGVLPDLPLRFPLERPGVWTTLELPRPGDASALSRSGVWLWSVARLAPGVALETAAAELHTIAARLRASHPVSNRERDVNVVPVRELVVGPVRPALLLLAGAVTLVLLVAVANVGNLLMVVAHGRRHELAVRAALGAGRARLARLVFAESLLLALAGTAVGLLLAPAVLRTLLANYPGGLPRAAEVGIHAPALVVAICAMLLAAVGAALPALHQTRRLDLQSTIRASASGGTRADERVRTMLVAAQIAMSVVLLFAGAVLWRSFDHLNRTDIGFESDGLLTFNISLNITRYRDASQEAAMHADLLARIRALPGVRDAGTSTLLPFAPGEFFDGFARDGHPEDVLPDLPTARLQNVTPGYLEALGLQSVAGRTFDAVSDRAGGTPVVVVSRELERRYFPDGAVGRRIEVRGEPREIVGVVSDKRHSGVRSGPVPELYVPKAQSDYPRLLAWVAVRTDGEPLALLPAVRQIVSEIDATTSLDDARTLDERLARALAPDRFRTQIVAALSAAAVLLSLLGLWGLIGYSVSRGMKETGIRMALGEAPGGALRRVLLRALRIALAGTAAGVALALAGARLLEGFVAGVPARDMTTLLIVVLVFLAASVLAALGPARRASATAPASIRFD